MTQPFLIEYVLKAADIDTRMTNLQPMPAALPHLTRPKMVQKGNTHGSTVL